MAKGRKAKKPQTPFDQLKELAPEWAESVLSKKDEELKAMTIQIELQTKLIEEAKKQDPDLPKLSEELKGCRETYDLPIKANRLKQRVIALLLEERGKA